MAVSTCTVHGLIVDSQGVARPGVVVLFEPLLDNMAPSVDKSTLILYRTVRVVTDWQGLVPSTELVASDATSVSVPWRVSVRAIGASQSFEFLAPAGGTVDLATVPQVPPLDAPVQAWQTLQASVAADADRAEAAAARAEAAPGSGPHTHMVADLSDASPLGRSLAQVADAASARAAIGAGTSSLELGTVEGTAPDAAAVDAALAGKAAAVHGHASSAISDATATGRALLTAPDAEAARAVIGAGTGSGSGSVAAADITDASVTGRAVLTAADAEAARTVLGAGSSDLVIGTTAGTAADAGAVTTALAGKAATSHSHATADVTGLDAALAGKAASSHSHATSDVTGLDAALAGKAATSHTHTAAQLSDSTATGRSLVTAADATAGRSALGAAATSHTHTASQISDSSATGRAVLAAADPAAARSAIGATGSPNGTVTGFAYYATEAELPVTGAAGVIYVTPAPEA